MLDESRDESEKPESPKVSAKKSPKSAPAKSASAASSPKRAHMVQCVKLGRRLPGLARPPVPGELGQRIYDSISQQAWEMWQDHSRLLINHYGLNLADPDARALMRQQMEEFFFGPGEEKPEGWVPEGQGGAKGKGAPAPAASRKK
ncbi:MAG TPA: oxidative damage protection protein [Ktedonobacterales bacterium]